MHNYISNTVHNKRYCFPLFLYINPYSFPYTNTNPNQKPPTVHILSSAQSLRHELLSKPLHLLPFTHSRSSLNKSSHFRHPQQLPIPCLGCRCPRRWSGARRRQNLDYQRQCWNYTGSHLGSNQLQLRRSRTWKLRDRRLRWPSRMPSLRKTSEHARRVRSQPVQQLGFHRYLARRRFQCSDGVQPHVRWMRQGDQMHRRHQRSVSERVESTGRL